MTTTRPTTTSGRGPVSRVLDLFSSVRLGIVLLVILLVYSWIGSAGLFFPTPYGWRHEMPRQYRMFELTEFEWFHTWFFIALTLAIAANIAVTTVRRIPFNAIKAGPWIIHSGILIMIAGSLIYFSAKLEGDTIVGLRKIVVQADDAPAPIELTPISRDRGVLETPGGDYIVTVLSVDPEWPLLSEGREGETAYVINLVVTNPEGRTYVRQLFRDDPELSEDLLPEEGRAKNALGRRFVDEGLRITTAPMEQDTFWIMHSSAIYLRPEGDAAWQVRPVDGLPRYNDYAQGGSLPPWPSPGAKAASEHAIAIDVPAPPADDPGAPDLPGGDFSITGFLRYANLQTRWVSDPAGIPVANATVREAAGPQRVVLIDEAATPADDDAADVFLWIPAGADADERIAALGDRDLRTIVYAGPDTGIHVVDRSPGGATLTHRPGLGEWITLSGGGELRIDSVLPSASPQVRPVIVPPQQRRKDADRNRLFAMIRLRAEWPDGRTESRWIPFAHYTSDDPLIERLPRGRVSPVVFTAPDGRRVEAKFSRERTPLPAPVRLDEFIVTEHEGGFTGDTLSIRDWTSVVTFAPGGADERTGSISTNAPQEHGGFWFFQSSWDPPAGELGSLTGVSASFTRAYAHTGLGVGNRHGVWTMLAGATISVLGMMYAFYVKPIIRRRRLAAALASADARHAARARSSSAPPPAPSSAASEPQEVAP